MEQKELRKMLEKERKEMLSIAKPFLLDGCADPMEAETFMTLLKRIDKPEKERKLIGNIILDLMQLSFEKAIQQGVRNSSQA